MTDFPHTDASEDFDPALSISSLHPECPDWQRLAPTRAEAKLRAAAAAQEADEQARTRSWGKFSRRKVLAGGLGVGVATLGSQLVTTRVSYAAGPQSAQGTLVVIFLRGGLDGLSMLVPASAPELRSARPSLAINPNELIPMGRGFGLHPAMAPLRSLVSAGQVAAVPAVATPDLSRSHFQAQDCLERGGNARGASQNGWLDKVVAATGPGTTFRSVGMSPSAPRALMGPTRAITMTDLTSVSVGGPDRFKPRTMEALQKLYTGLDNPISGQAFAALDAAQQMVSSRMQRAEAGLANNYPEGALGSSLKSLAALIKSGSGVRVANVDVGGWDTHTRAREDLNEHLGDLATALSVFANDLGSHLDRTTIVTMSEFGRRVAQNGTAGTDHGHGGVLLALGGGVRGGVHGQWKGLAPSVLDNGDVPGWNDYRDVLSELVMGRVGLSSSQASAVFGGWKPSRVGIMA